MKCLEIRSFSHDYLIKDCLLMNYRCVLPSHKNISPVYFSDPYVQMIEVFVVDHSSLSFLDSVGSIK